MSSSDSDCQEAHLSAATCFKRKFTHTTSLIDNKYDFLLQIQSKIWCHFNKKRFLKKTSVLRYLNKLKGINSTDRPVNMAIKKYTRQLNLIMQEIQHYEESGSDIHVNLDLSQDISGVNDLQKCKDITKKASIINLDNDYDELISASLLSNTNFVYSDPVYPNEIPVTNSEEVIVQKSVITEVQNSNDSGISSWNSNEASKKNETKETSGTSKRKSSESDRNLVQAKKSKNESFIRLDHRVFHNLEVADDFEKRMDIMVDDFKSFYIREINKKPEERKTGIITEALLKDRNWQHLAVVYENMYRDLLNSIND